MLSNFCAYQSCFAAKVFTPIVRKRELSRLTVDICQFQSWAIQADNIACLEHALDNSVVRSGTALSSGRMEK